MGGFAGFALITFLANIEHNPAIVGFFAPSMLLLCFVLGGFRVVSPNEAYVATFCGSYKGVLRKHGLRYVFPLFKTKMVSLRLMNFESPTVKVNDLGGCPVDMRAVVVWRVVSRAGGLPRPEPGPVREDADGDRHSLARRPVPLRHGAHGPRQRRWPERGH